MKKLILINGTMGVGKSTVCKQLLTRLQPGVWLDGDWCWNMEPFVVNEENKAMVLSNITYLLRSFLLNSGYEYVIFCWVIHQEEIMQQLLQRLEDLSGSYEPLRFTLTCSETALRQRLERDIAQGLRRSDVVERSLQRLPLYRQMDSQKLDCTFLTPEETAELLAQEILAK